MPQTAHRATLADLRQEAGLTQAQLAHRLTMSQAQISKLEKSSNPGLLSLRRYVTAIGELRSRHAELDVVVAIGADVVALDFPHPVAPDQDAVQVWRMTAWNDRLLEEQFLKRGVIAVGDPKWQEELPAHPDDEWLRAKLRETHSDEPGVSARTIGQWVKYWRIFLREMADDDFVVLAQVGGLAAVGRLTSEYDYIADGDYRLQHTRTINWLDRNIPRRALPDGIRKVVNAPGTVHPIRAPGAAAWCAQRRSAMGPEDGAVSAE